MISSRPPPRPAVADEKVGILTTSPPFRGTWGSARSCAIQPHGRRKLGLNQENKSRLIYIQTFVWMSSPSYHSQERGVWFRVPAVACDPRCLPWGLEGCSKRLKRIAFVFRKCWPWVIKRNDMPTYRIRCFA